MRHLVTTNCAEPYFTDWYDSENTHNADVEMIVYDLMNGIYTKDGIN